MAASKPELAMNIEQIKDTWGVMLENVLEVRFPHTVKCEIDIQNRTARVGRMEIILKDERYQMMGWRAKIVLLRGIDHRVTLDDTIVLNTIVPGVICPIGPYSTEIPRDIIKSEDEWNLELYVVDPYNNQALIHRSPNVSFAELRGQVEEKEDKRIRYIPKEQRVKTDRCELLCGDAGKRCRYLIYAKPKLIFGKRETNDIVLQLFPRNPENDAATAKISREHGKFEYNKGRWTLQDTSMNHTWINDKYMSKDSTETLHDGDKIVVARVLELQFHCDDKYARIDRLNNLAGEEAYILMIESVTIGSDPNNGIVLLDAGVSAFHARIFHKDGEFFIQAVGDDSSVVVNDSPLKQNEVCPLGKDMEFSIGKFTLGVQAHND